MNTDILNTTAFKKVVTGNETIWMYRAECTFARFNKVKLYFTNNGLGHCIGSYSNGYHTIALKRYNKNKFERMESLLNL